MTKNKFIPLVIILALLSAVAMFALDGTARRMGEGNFFGDFKSVEDRGMMGSPMMGDVVVERGMGSSIAPSAGVAQDKMMYGEPAIMPYYPAPGDALDVENRAIEKYASYSLIVNDVSDYMRKTRDYLSSIGGRVLSYNQGTSDQYNYGYITAKVPEDKFDEATSQLVTDVKKVMNETVSAQDVTGQTVTIAETLQQLQDQKAERELALEEATTETEKRRIQLEIDRLERQIQQTEQTQTGVEERVTYSTITISVANKEYYFNGGGPRPLMDVLREAWDSLQGTGFGIVAFLIWVLVYAIVWIPVLLLVRWIWGKVRPTAPITTK